jgi:hypothetical protein
MIVLPLCGIQEPIKQYFPALLTQALKSLGLFIEGTCALDVIAIIIGNPGQTARGIPYLGDQSLNQLETNAHAFHRCIELMKLLVEMPNAFQWIFCRPAQF